MDCPRGCCQKAGLQGRKRHGPPRRSLSESAPGTLAQTKDHSSRWYVIYNLDSNRHEVYRESNLIEARAAAILTPHLMRHTPAVFLKSFPVSSHILMIRSGQNGWAMDKLREHVFSCEENVEQRNPYSCHSE